MLSSKMKGFNITVWTLSTRARGLHLTLNTVVALWSEGISQEWGTSVYDVAWPAVWESRDE
jgi:hypothetical protein